MYAYDPSIERILTKICTSKGKTKLLFLLSTMFIVILHCKKTINQKQKEFDEKERKEKKTTKLANKITYFLLHYVFISVYFLLAAVAIRF